MTDFDYDIRQKKLIARSASKRKCGSKSRKCSLPSDTLTNRQWKELNGQVDSYDLSAPMSWSAFKRMPYDIQKEYLAGLSEKYGVNMSAVSDMFGVSYALFYQYLRRHKDEIGHVFRTEGKMRRDDRAAWECFLKEKGYDPDRGGSHIAKTSADTWDCKGSLRSVSFRFSGPFDPEEIAAHVRDMITDREVDQVDISITFK